MEKASPPNSGGRCLSAPAGDANLCVGGTPAEGGVRALVRYFLDRPALAANFSPPLRRERLRYIMLLAFHAMPGSSFSFSLTLTFIQLFLKAGT